MTLKSQIEKAAACLEVTWDSEYMEYGRQAENARLQPLISALAECVEALETISWPDENVVERLHDKAHGDLLEIIDTDTTIARQALGRLKAVLGGEG